MLSWVGVSAFVFGDFVIWNPTTGDSRKLPVTTPLQNRLLGLGYDCLGRDHKLVVVIKSGMTISNQGKEFSYRVVDYSLRKDTILTYNLQKDFQRSSALSPSKSYRGLLYYAAFLGCFG
ncbi:hypothetical protein MLD38_029892 [Melastoma candidum]|uniref:Uncharacterized protein n=1 Tax=Melastoma candidum TaxID=119954 RepID=A0ACB9N545_9MYRT|nr:hypothetical protein MLD38_029892 [Melastoma candidum]